MRLETPAEVRHQLVSEWHVAWWITEIFQAINSGRPLTINVPIQYHRRKR